MNESEVKNKKKKKANIGYYLWCLVGILAAIPVLFEIRLGADKIHAIRRAVVVTEYLEYPESMEIYGIYELNIQLADSQFYAEDDEDITEYAKSLLGDAPLLTYVMYVADDRNGTEIEDVEVFVYKDDQPIGSSDNNGESLTTTLEFQSAITEDDEMIMRFAFAFLDSGLNEEDSIDGTVLIVEDWELDGQLMLFPYLLALVALSVIVFAINLSLSKKSRARMKKEREEQIQTAVKLAEDVYPQSMIPDRHERFTVENRDCVVWVYGEMLHILQSKESLLNHARSRPESFDDEEKIMKKMFSRNIWLKDICELDIDADKSCLMFYKKGNETNVLELGKDSYRFTTRLRDELFAGKSQRDTSIAR
ncbi:MAG: phage tail protein [Clostridiales bacterium]|nr:phage tail protein [Clostridiales bacterium]